MFANVELMTDIAGVKMLIISNGLTDETIPALEQSEFSKLKIHYGNWEDLSFLAPFKEKITELTINAEKIDGDSLKHLTELKALYITESLNLVIDFTNFKKLVWFRAKWHKNYDIESFYNLPNLKYLWIYGWKDLDCQKLSAFKGLQFLELYNSRNLTSLHGIEKMPLVNVDIGSCSNLTDISALRGKGSISSLSLTTCKKISNYDAISTLTGLMNLDVTECAPLKHLEVIKPLEQLRSLNFAMTGLEDGNLSVLFQMPNLSDVWFTDKRNFSHKKKEVLPFFERRTSVKNCGFINPDIVLLGHKPISCS